MLLVPPSTRVVLASSAQRWGCHGDRRRRLWKGRGTPTPVLSLEMVGTPRRPCGNEEGDDEREHQVFPGGKNKRGAVGDKMAPIWLQTTKRRPT